MIDDKKYVFEYSIDRLKELISYFSKNPPYIIENKFHTTYFNEYFDHKDINAKTIVVERNYIDRDFLEDYAAYYVKCFEEYDRYCTRLHFFRTTFDQVAFDSLLTGTDSTLDTKTLQDTYLGFIVVKHLPGIVIGRTCLKTYSDDNNRRQYPITRTYKAHLFGLDLEVKTIAFQEQDNVVSACATSALWSAFQATGRLFDHSIPSPVGTTKAASKHIPVRTRILPNSGLTIMQMTNAIREVGLDPHIIDLENLANKRGMIQFIVAAYMRIGIPVLMGFKPSGSTGEHTVTVTGFSLGIQSSGDPNLSNFFLRCTRMDKIYAHDDQIGPFARMTFESDSQELKTSWPDNNHNIGNITAKPPMLILPLYHNIRVPADCVLRSVSIYSEMFHSNVTKDVLAKGTHLDWDIYMTTCCTLKADVRGLPVISKKKSIILRKPMPRYLWRATAKLNEEHFIDFLFNATGVESDKILFDIIEYHDSCSAFSDIYEIM